MTDGIDEEVLDRLEAEAMVADADAEELTLAVESDIEQKQDEIEELRADVEEKDAEVEELQSRLEEKDEEIEEMKDDIQAVAEDYAEELAQDSEVFDAEDYIEKFEFEELRQKANELQETEPEPSPNSGDPGANIQSPDEPEEGEPEEPDLSEHEELAASAFEKRAKKSGKDYWADIAQDIKEGGE